jgi:hypothetical protein
LKQKVEGAYGVDRGGVFLSRYFGVRLSVLLGYFQVKAGVFDEVRFLYAGQCCTRTEIIFSIPVQYKDVRAEVSQMEFRQM